MKYILTERYDSDHAVTYEFSTKRELERFFKYFGKKLNCTYELEIKEKEDGNTNS